MRFQRLVAAAPFAFAAAALTHVVEFGFTHALGGAQGIPLNQSLLALLACCAVGAILWGAFLGKRGAVLESTSFAQIVAGALAFYVVLESSEGHAGLINVGTIVLIVAFSAMIRSLAGSLGQRLGKIGIALAIAFAEAARGVASFSISEPQFVLAKSYSPATNRRGRAPPSSR